MEELIEEAEKYVQTNRDSLPELLLGTLHTVTNKDCHFL
jgi:hypothetical protein